MQIVSFQIQNKMTQLLSYVDKAYTINMYDQQSQD